ncbi:hypothetical protein PFISCL1PPCAC_23018, partial [Pristionchus fissidentatus]
GTMNEVVAIGALREVLVGKALNEYRNIPAERKKMGVQECLDYLASKLSEESPFHVLDVEDKLRRQTVGGRTIAKVCEEIDKWVDRLHKEEAKREEVKLRQLLLLYKGKPEYLKMLEIYEEEGTYEKVKSLLVRMEYTKGTIGGVAMEAVMDTGAEVSLISMQRIEGMSGIVIEKCETDKVKGVSGPVKIIGRCVLTVDLSMGKKTEVGFFVSSHTLGINDVVLLGNRALQAMGIGLVELPEGVNDEKSGNIEESGQKAIVLRDVVLGPREVGNVIVGCGVMKGVRLIDVNDYKNKHVLMMERMKREVNLRLDAERKRMKGRYDKKYQHNKGREPRVGDRVYVREEVDRGKLNIPWIGPFRVKERSETTATLCDLRNGGGEKLRKVQLDRLRLVPKGEEEEELSVNVRDCWRVGNVMREWRKEEYGRSEVSMHVYCRTTIRKASLLHPLKECVECGDIEAGDVIEDVRPELKHLKVPSMLKLARVFHMNGRKWEGILEATRHFSDESWSPGVESLKMAYKKMCVHRTMEAITIMTPSVEVEEEEEEGRKAIESVLGVKRSKE